MHLYFSMREMYKYEKYYQNNLLRLKMEAFFLSYLLINLNEFEFQSYKHPTAYAIYKF